MSKIFFFFLFFYLPETDFLKMVLRKNLLERNDAFKIEFFLLNMNSIELFFFFSPSVSTQSCANRNWTHFSKRTRFNEKKCASFFFPVLFFFFFFFLRDSQKYFSLGVLFEFLKHNSKSSSFFTACLHDFLLPFIPPF